MSMQFTLFFVQSVRGVRLHGWRWRSKQQKIAEIKGNFIINRRLARAPALAFGVRLMCVSDQHAVQGISLVRAILGESHNKRKAYHTKLDEWMDEVQRIKETPVPAEAVRVGRVAEACIVG